MSFNTFCFGTAFQKNCSIVFFCEEKLGIEKSLKRKNEIFPKKKKKSIQTPFSPLGFNKLILSNIDSLVRYLTSSTADTQNPETDTDINQQLVAMKLVTFSQEPDKSSNCRFWRSHTYAAETSTLGGRIN